MLLLCPVASMLVSSLHNAQGIRQGDEWGQVRHLGLHFTLFYNALHGLHVYVSVGGMDDILVIVCILLMLLLLVTTFAMLFCIAKYALLLLLISPFIPFFSHSIKSSVRHSWSLIS